MIYGRVNRCSAGPGTRSPREDKEEGPGLSRGQVSPAPPVLHIRHCAPNPVADIHHASAGRGASATVHICPSLGGVVHVCTRMGTLVSYIYIYIYT